jgi:hypothetical protein
MYRQINTHLCIKHGVHTSKELSQLMMRTVLQAFDPTSPRHPHHCIEMKSKEKTPNTH